MAWKCVSVRIATLRNVREAWARNLHCVLLLTTMRGQPFVFCFGSYRTSPSALRMCTPLVILLERTLWNARVVWLWSANIEVVDCVQGSIRCCEAGCAQGNRQVVCRQDC